VLCQFLSTCKIVAADAGACDTIESAQELGCTADSAFRVDAGLLRFEPGAADGCLAALSDAGCTAAGILATTTACDAQAWLVGNVPLGGPCFYDTDCLAVDAGPVRYGEHSPGCYIDVDSVPCGGVCSVGPLLGDLCDLGFTDGCAAGQGTCEYQPYLADGGSANVCQPFVADGGPCTDVYTPVDCDSVVSFCGDAGPSGTTCQPLVPPGSPCDLLLCSTYPAQCQCGAFNVCSPVGDGGTGTCSALGVNTPCLSAGGPYCGISSSCISTTFADAGPAGSFCQWNFSVLGELCDQARFCVNGLQCSNPISGTCVPSPVDGQPCNTDSYSSCAAPWQCVSSDGGSVGTCLSLGGVGSSCFSVGCAGLLACTNLADGGYGCVADLAPGASCDPTGPDLCGVGFCNPGPDGGSGMCTESRSLGQPCSPQVPDQPQCAENGGCFGAEDGGWFCASTVCAD
jgi:hypothetical protein